MFIRKWLVGMVSGLFETYSLLTLVFVGKQGSGKTKWFRDILPDELRQYYAEAKFDDDKDHQILLTIKAIVMDDEFTGKTKKEAGLFKKMSSTDTITIRKPYAKRPETHRRIAALAGTTNDSDIFNDPTGNRRIIPVKVDSVDWELYYSVDKDELFMEIYREWEANGDNWMLSPAEIEILNHHTSGYEAISPEEELIRKYFMPPITDRDLKDYDFSMTNTEILNFLQGRLHGSNIKLTTKSIGDRLKKMGYAQKSTKDRGRLYAIKLNDDGNKAFSRDEEDEQESLAFSKKEQDEQLSRSMATYQNIDNLNNKFNEQGFTLL